MVKSYKTLQSFQESLNAYEVETTAAAATTTVDNCGDKANTLLSEQFGDVSSSNVRDNSNIPNTPVEQPTETRTPVVQAPPPSVQAPPPVVEPSPVPQAKSPTPPANPSRPPHPDIEEDLPSSDSELETPPSLPRLDNNPPPPPSQQVSSAAADAPASVPPSNNTISKNDFDNFDDEDIELDLENMNLEYKVCMYIY